MKKEVMRFCDSAMKEVGELRDRMFVEGPSAPEFTQFVLRLLYHYSQAFGLEGGHVTCDDILDTLRADFKARTQALHEANCHEGEAAVAELWATVESYLYGTLLIDDTEEIYEVGNEV